MLEIMFYTVLYVFVAITLILLITPFTVYLFGKPIALYIKYMEKYWIWISKKLNLK